MEYLNITGMPEQHYCINAYQRCNVRTLLSIDDDDFVMLPIELSIISPTIYPMLKSIMKYVLDQDRYEFLYKIDSSIFNAITHLKLYDADEFKPYYHHCTSLKYLELLYAYEYEFLNRLPTTLEVLRINHGYNDDMYFNDECYDDALDSEYQMHNLPPGLKILDIDIEDFNQPLDMLPHSLEILYISSGTFNKPLENLPSALKILFINSVYGKYEYPINALPDNLQILVIDKNKFKCENKCKLNIEKLPSTLKYCILIGKHKYYSKLCNDYPNVKFITGKTLPSNFLELVNEIL